MLYEIMKHLKNFFPTHVWKESEFTIEDGAISLSFVKEGQYILIEGSSFNDGVYLYPCEGLTDETFKGIITVLAPPKDFIELAKEIKAFTEKNEASPYQSESFGGYSYTRATNSKGALADWHDVYRARLNSWRCL